MKRVLLSWSSGKDSAWALYLLRPQADVEVAGLLTTFNESADRVSMHAVRRDLVEMQAESAGLPLTSVMLPWPCSNSEYERIMGEAIGSADDITHIAFGDLFLEDVKAYRVRQLAGSGIEPLFPMWHPPGGTAALAREMVEAGLRAVVTCVDPAQLDASFVGRTFDAEMLSELPPEVDPCGERGEFHTFCFAGPMYRRSIPVEVGEKLCRDGFWFADVQSAPPRERT